MPVSTHPPTRRFAGWQPAGMLDWPGRLAATVFLSGCDFHCPFCHNPALLHPHEAAVWGDLVAHLRSRAAWIDGVVVSGGEPTTDPDLLALLAELKVLGLPVKLDTNGCRPDLLEEIIQLALVDYVAMDIKTSLDRYHLVTNLDDAGTRVRRSIAIVLASGIEHEFRTTVYPPVVAPRDLMDIASLLQGGKLYAIQQFRPQHTLDGIARDVEPASPLALLDAAADCCAWIPTVTRGV